MSALIDALELASQDWNYGHLCLTAAERIAELEARLAPITSLSDECVRALTHKTQVDECGAIVGVSHQAVDEIHDALLKARTT